MSDRTRGVDTRIRILEEACRAFAEKGYRDATHAEICRAAQTNIASINYHFQSKEALYRAACEHLSQQEELAHPLNGNLAPGTPPERRLRAFIDGLLARIFEPGPQGHLHRILMSERFSPTGHLDDLLESWLFRDRTRILGILRELLGPQAPEQTVLWCEMSIIGQCMVGVEDTDPKAPRNLFGLDNANRDRLAEHIYQFSLGGIRAIRRQLPKPGD